MTIQDDCPPGRLVKFNPRLPSSARVTAYWLGGKDALEADRAEADRVSTVAFEVPNMLRAHRDFLCRAVEFLARRGIDQFIEIGCGLPAPRHNVHQVARTASPDAVVVYTDVDEQVLAHARALLGSDDGVYVAFGDLRRPGELMDAAGRYLDLRRPVGLLAVSVMHFISDDQDPAGIVHTLMGRAAQGSHLVVSQVMPGGNMPLANAGYRVSSGRMVLRDVEQVRPWLAGLEVVEPGLVLVNQWRLFDDRPAYVDFDPAMPAWVLGAAAKKP